MVSGMYVSRNEQVFHLEEERGEERRGEERRGEERRGEEGRGEERRGEERRGEERAPSCDRLSQFLLTDVRA